MDLASDRFLLLFKVLLALLLYRGAEVRLAKILPTVIRRELTLYARRTPHSASRLVHAMMPAWFVKTRRALVPA